MWDIRAIDATTPGLSPESSSDGTDISIDDASAGDESLDPTPDDSEPACFPADATVELSNGERKSMAHLRLGDVVKVGAGQYSPIYFFSHAHEKTRASMVEVEIEESNMTFSSSPGHLVRLASGILKPISQVAVNDKILIAGTGNKAESAIVTRVARRIGHGKFNPHTLHGDIVVNGFIASTFTTAVHPVVARGLLLPVRAVFRAFNAHPHLISFNYFVLRILEASYWNR